MKTNVKRIFSLLLAAALLCGGLAVPAGAATAQAKDAAAALYELGLFSGSGTLSDGSPNFDLDGTATRAQAAVMITRLWGAEQEARSKHYSHPFTDAGWASDFIGYVYQNKIAYGTSGTLFGSGQQIDAAQFVTLVLRALGYGQVDWRDPWSTAKSVGLAYSGVNDFRRGDMALICHSALSCRISGSSQTLLQRLKAQGAVKSGNTAAAAFVPGPVPPAVTGSYSVTSPEEARARFLSAVGSRATPIVLTGPASILHGCLEVIQLCAGDNSDITGVSITAGSTGSTMTISIEPFYTDAVEIMAYLEGKRSTLSVENQLTLAKALQIHSGLAKPGMSEYDRVKAFHDYLVNNITYGGKGNGKFTAGGALLDGYAV